MQRVDVKIHTRVVWLGYASIILALVWGVGIIAAIWAIRIAKGADVGMGTDQRIQRDLRGGLLLARAGLVLNAIVLVVIAWSIVTTLV